MNERVEMLLLQVMEECAEISQRVSKAKRFTLDEVQEGQDLDNRERILAEFNDLIGLMEMLVDEGVFSDGIYKRDLIEAKKVKFEKWYNYSIKMNCVK